MFYPLLPAFRCRRSGRFLKSPKIKTAAAKTRQRSVIFHMRHCFPLQGPWREDTDVTGKSSGSWVIASAVFPTRKVSDIMASARQIQRRLRAGFSPASFLCPALTGHLLRFLRQDIITETFLIIKLYKQRLTDARAAYRLVFSVTADGEENRLFPQSEKCPPKGGHFLPFLYECP